MLKEAESSRMETRRRATILKLVNTTLRSERDNILSMPKAKEARLDERIGESDKENSELLERISAVEGQNALFLERPSTSHTSKSPAIPRKMYEGWILAEA